MANLEYQVRDNLKNGIFCEHEQDTIIAIAKILDLIKKEYPEMTLSQLFKVLDDTKDFVLENKTLKDKFIQTRK